MRNIEVSLQLAGTTVRRLAEELSRDVDRALSEAADLVLKEARTASSGPYSLKQLRRMGHPYARRHARPLLDPRIINRQSGAFLAAWKSTEPYSSGDDRQIRIYNDDPKAAQFLEPGTRRMVERPIDDLVKEQAEPAVYALWDKIFR